MKLIPPFFIIRKLDSNSSGGGKNSKKEVSDVRFEGVCSPDGNSQAPRDGFMVSLKTDI